MHQQSYQSLKRSIDKWIEQAPFQYSDDGYNEYIEQVYDNMSEPFIQDVYEKRTGFENSAVEISLLDKMFRQDRNPAQAAKIIERFYSIHKEQIKEKIFLEYMDAVLKWARIPESEFQSRKVFYTDVIKICQGIPMTIPQAGKHIFTSYEHLKSKQL